MKQCYFVFLVALSLNSNYLHSEDFSYKGDCIYHPDFNCLNNCLDDCLDRELKNYDRELNILYKKVYVKSNRNKLKKAERLWIEFKRADCDYMASEVNGGKQYNEIYPACLINRTKERIRDLKRSYSFFGWFRGRIDAVSDK